MQFNWKFPKKCKDGFGAVMETSLTFTRWQEATSHNLLLIGEYIFLPNSWLLVPKGV